MNDRYLVDGNQLRDLTIFIEQGKKEEAYELIFKIATQFCGMSDHSIDFDCATILTEILENAPSEEE